MVKSVSESHRTSITIQCSARQSKWTQKWTSLSLVSELGKLGIPAVTASLRVTLPRAVFKVSLAVRHSDGKSSSSTIRKTVKFFGLLKTRKVCLRLSRCFRNLKERTFLRRSCDSGGGISRKDAQGTKLVELEHVEEQQEAFDKSLWELATWVFRRRNCRQSQLKVFMGNWSLLSHFASEKTRWAIMAFQVGVVLLTLMLPSQLGIARAVWRAACTAAASVVIGLVLNFFGVKNKLSTELGKLWGEAVSVGPGGETVSPQVVWTLVEPFIRSSVSRQMIFGTAALFMIILFHFSASSLGTIIVNRYQES